MGLGGENRRRVEKEKDEKVREADFVKKPAGSKQ